MGSANIKVTASQFQRDNGKYDWQSHTLVSSLCVHLKPFNYYI